MKEAIVFKRTSGLWEVKDRATGMRIGGLHNTEIEAYRAANQEGYIVR